MQNIEQFVRERQEMKPLQTCESHLLTFPKKICGIRFALQKNCPSRYDVLPGYRRLITRDGLCDKEIRRRIGMGKAATRGLTTILKDSGIKLATKVKLVNDLLFPIVLYGTENWTIRKGERKKM